jgi:hypothetical protein
MPPSLTRADIFRTYWPLAASWLMMGLELPAVSAVMARFANPEIHLAAYGGIVFPIALIVEAPIIMLLAASTALSRDRVSYRKLRRFMVTTAAGLTMLHLLIATTPLFDFVVGTLLDAPMEIRAAGRLGLLLMLPWTACIAYRRFHQGVLIRFGHSRRVGIGTMVRLGTNASVLAIGAAIGQWPGIAIGTSAVACGVLAEALFIGRAVRPVLRHELPDADPAARPLTRRSFVRFYTPLAMTSFLSLLALPLGSAAMGRLPLSLESLAIWPVLNGLTFTLRSLGLAYNEVVVSLLDREGAYRPLRDFALRLATTASGILLLVAATPLSILWLRDVSGLRPELAALAARALWIAVPFPAGSVLVAWLMGILVHEHRTMAISEAVGLHVLTVTTFLGLGIAWQGAEGILVTVSATLVAFAVQLAWLGHRALPSIREIVARTAVPSRET